MSVPSQSPRLRPRLVGDAVMLGSSTILGKRMVQNGCWSVERHSPSALSRLLSISYGKRITEGDPMVVRLYRAMDNLPISTHQAERLLDGLPEPLADADRRLAQADRLLKSGVDPDELEVAMRREGLKLRPAPDWAEQLTLSDKGVMLGQGVVVAKLESLPDGRTGIEVTGKEERILTL